MTQQIIRFQWILILASATEPSEGVFAPGSKKISKIYLYLYDFLRKYKNILKD